MKMIPTYILVYCEEIRRQAASTKKIAMAVIVLGILSNWTLNAQIATITDNALSFSINGTPTTVGTMTASLYLGRNLVANDNKILATASLNAPFANDGTFHWIQIITSATPAPAGGPIQPGPLIYNNQPLDNSAANNPLPIIDPPNGGYAGATIPEDNLPWYLTLAQEGGSSAFYVGNTINGDGSGTYTMADQPGYGGFNFDTFLVAETGAKSFGLIEDFSWGYGVNGGAASLTKGPTLTYKPGATEVTEMINALANGGFAGWTAQLGYNFVTVPEPATYALFIVGVLMTLVSVRAKRNSAS